MLFSARNRDIRWFSPSKYIKDIRNMKFFFNFFSLSLTNGQILITKIQFQTILYWLLSII